MVASERGETLIELLVAVMIMGIGLVAVVGGLAVSIHASDIHRKQATAGSAARNYAETVENWVTAGNFPSCDGSDAYPAAAVPDGYAGNVTSCYPVSDGLRRLTVTVSSSDDRATESVVFVVRRPCGPGDPPC
jgi:prepilin-type N-terminal cleavage/methylation domain-containing protein